MIKGVKIIQGQLKMCSYSLREQMTCNSDFSIKQFFVRLAALTS